MMNAHDRPVGSRLKNRPTGRIYRKFVSGLWQEIGNERAYPIGDCLMQTLIDSDCMEDVVEANNG